MDQRIGQVEQVERVQALVRVATPGLSAHLQAFRASYSRGIPWQYLDNPYIRTQIDLNILMAEEGGLFVPRSPQATFQPFYEELRGMEPNLVRQIVSPAGSAKVASSSQITPIKEITQKRLSGFSLPGDPELYGWGALEAEAARAGRQLLLMFQGNGLYYNRGSVLFDGQDLYDYPNSILADYLEGQETPESREWLGLEAAPLKRPLLFYAAGPDGRMAPYLHQFQGAETYRQGMRRLLEEFRRRGVRAALAASPPLILPGAGNQPEYLPLPTILGQFHANDIRHYLYCPYQGGVLLSAELGRAQCLQPGRLAGALAGTSAQRVRLRLRETLRYVSAEQLLAILENKGYAGRFALEKSRGPSGEEVFFLSIHPLEGVYSHLIVFLTQQGRFGLIQTSGTRGNITGNDGPTLVQLSAILRDLNAQPLFEHDPIIAASSGSQGNDVPNVLGRTAAGNPSLLFQAAPSLSLDEHSVARGIVTTPRVGIALGSA